MSSIVAAIGRIFIAFMFVVSGTVTLMTLDQAETMNTSVGLPSGLAIPVGVFELVVGFCLAIGLMTRLSAILLAAFVGLATLFFHNRFTDPVHGVQAIKNLAIIGGLLAVFAQSQMRWSYDVMRRARRHDAILHNAEEKIHAGELRVARMEGAADPVGTPPVPPRRRWF